MAKMKQQRLAEAQEARSARTPSIDNRRARHDYAILESFEAGIALTGTEVKSIRAGGASIAESYARIRDGELWLLSMHVPSYREGTFSNVDPKRPRKLLVHREQIARLKAALEEKGLTLIPLRLYFTRGKVKIELGLARGKKMWDKRADLVKRESARETERELARR